MYWQLLLNDLINQHVLNYHCRYLPQDETNENSEPTEKKPLQQRIDLPNGHYLTQREAECISLAMQGMTMKMIGLHLDLSPRTIEYYLKRVKERMGCRTKKELVNQIRSQCSGRQLTA